MFFEGNYELAIDFFSCGQGVSLTNPFGGIVQGFEGVAKKLRLAVANCKEGVQSALGTLRGILPATWDIFWRLKDAKQRSGGRRDITPMSLRVTSIFRLENGTWMLVRRRAESLVPPQELDSGIRTQT
jgi:hypothetical protein